MPRLIHALPKYRKHRASGQAVVTLNGRDHYLGPHGTKASKREYDRLVAEFLSSGRSVAFGAPQHDLTVVELAANYVRYAKGYYGTAKTSEYFRILRIIRPVKDLYSRLPAVEFGPVQFKAVRQGLVAENLSRTYINEFMRRVVAMFKWAAAEGQIPAAVPQALGVVPGLRRGKTEARETEPVLPVDDAVVDATLPWLPDIVADMVRLQRLTGARPAEVCALRPCDLDRSEEVWRYSLTRHKTAHHGRSRVILIGPKAQAVLLRYLARDAEAYCFRPVDSEAKRRAAQRAARKTPLSCGNRPGTNRVRRPKRTPGGRYTTASYRRAINRGCDKAFPHLALCGIPEGERSVKQSVELRKWQHDHRWSPNQLRHTAATEVRRQFGLEAAQVILGHSQANVTQVYAERDLARGLEVARAIG